VETLQNPTKPQIFYCLMVSIQLKPDFRGFQVGETANYKACRGAGSAPSTVLHPTDNRYMTDEPSSMLDQPRSEVLQKRET
jgi:hypothetical protein